MDNIWLTVLITAGICVGIVFIYKIKRGLIGLVISTFFSYGVMGFLFSFVYPQLEGMSSELIFSFFIAAALIILVFIIMVFLIMKQNTQLQKKTKQQERELKYLRKERKKER